MILPQVLQNRGHLRTEGNSVDFDEFDPNIDSGSDTDFDNSGFIDLQRLDDEKMAELLEDH